MMLYLTLMYEKEKEKEYLLYSKASLQAADNTFQWNLLDGFQKNIGPEKIAIINSLPFGSYPINNRLLFIKGRNFLHKSGSYVADIGFVNLPFLKHVTRLIKYIHNLRKAYRLGERNVVIYGLYLPQLLAIKHIKLMKKYSCINVCLVLDDLPSHYGIVKGNIIVVKIRNIIGQYILNILNDGFTINSFTFLTENMKEVINLKNRNYTVVEGIADNNSTNIEERDDVGEEINTKIIFYGGTLNKEFGIRALLNAFRMITDKTYQLWICGDGDAKEEVIGASHYDNRISYFGFLPKKEADELQRKATILVNPRKSDAVYTKYSFPSKTIEYLLSAKPIVMYKLEGIPDDYDEYLYYVNGATDEALARKIIEVCTMEPKILMQRSNIAKKWVLSHKNTEVQSMKILNLLKMMQVQ